MAAAAGHSGDALTAQADPDSEGGGGDVQHELIIEGTGDDDELFDG
eukprot:gene20682-62331_t